MSCRTSRAVQRREFVTGIPIMCFYEKGLESKPTVVGGFIADVASTTLLFALIEGAVRRCKLVSVDRLTRCQLGFDLCRSAYYAQSWETRY